MKLLLICNTAIIEHIFTLVCNRLNIELIVQQTTDVKQVYDVIVVDQPFIDNSFKNLRKQATLTGAISAEDLPLDILRDFLIPRPFLPTKLEILLKEQLEVLKSKPQIDNSTNFVSEKDSEVVSSIVDFINDDLEDLDNSEFEIEEDFKDDTEDESIVSLRSLHKGGVLDNSELDKINTILKDEPINNLEEEDWKDITKIIDEALDEVRDYEFDINEQNIYHLFLNRYKIDEIKPLLTKLNQDLVNKLSKGETVDIKISLKE